MGMKLLQLKKIYLLLFAIIAVLCACVGSVFAQSAVSSQSSSSGSSNTNSSGNRGNVSSGSSASSRNDSSSGRSSTSSSASGNNGSSSRSIVSSNNSSSSVYSRPLTNKFRRNDLFIQGCIAVGGGIFLIIAVIGAQIIFWHVKSKRDHEQVQQAKENEVPMSPKVVSLLEKRRAEREQTLKTQSAPHASESQAPTAQAGAAPILAADKSKEKRTRASRRGQTPEIPTMPHSPEPQAPTAPAGASPVPAADKPKEKRTKTPKSKHTKSQMPADQPTAPLKQKPQVQEEVDWDRFFEEFQHHQDDRS